MSIFNTIAGGGGGGGLIDAELVSETTGTYAGYNYLRIASEPPFTFSTEYVYVVDIQLNETPTQASQLVRFIGLLGQHAASNRVYDTLSYPHGIAVVYNYGGFTYATVNARDGSGYVTQGTSNQTHSFYIGDLTLSTNFVNGTTYSVKFYKITLS